MLLSNLIYSDFDINCEYEVYYCENEDITWNDGGIKIIDSTNWCEPLEDYLNMKVKYVTIHNSKLIIEIRKKEI